MLIAQRSHLTDFILTQNEVFIIKNGQGNTELGVIPRFLSITMNYDIRFAFTLAHSGPLHFTGKISSIYTRPNKPVKIHNNFTFFYPKDCEKLMIRIMFIFFLCTVPGEGYINEIKFLVLSESLQDFNTLVSPQDIEDKFDKTRISPEEILN